MRHFVLSYDLHNFRDYSRIINEITRLGGVRLLESLWLFSSDNNASEVMAHFRAFIDNDDSLAVIELKTGSLWSTLSAQPAGIAWLKRNISS